MLETGLLDGWFRATLREHQHRAFTRFNQLRSNQSFEHYHQQESSSMIRINSFATSGSGGSLSALASRQQESDNMHSFRVDEFESSFFLYFGGHCAALAALIGQVAYWRWWTTKTIEKTKRINCFSYESFIETGKQSTINIIFIQQTSSQSKQSIVTNKNYNQSNKQIETRIFEPYYSLSLSFHLAFLKH